MNKLSALLFGTVAVALGSCTTSPELDDVKYLLTHSRPLVDPAPIQIQPPRDREQLLAAIARAASTTGWQDEIKDTNLIEVTYKYGQHSAVTKIKVDPDVITIGYVDSRNLDYSHHGRQPTIHKAYLEWVDKLAGAINKNVNSLCADFNSLQDSGSRGRPYKSLIEKLPSIGSPTRELEVRSSTRDPTGYIVREYEAYLRPSQGKDCDVVSLVFYENNFITAMKATLEQTALAAYTDVLNFLVQKGAIKFSDAELERISLKLDTVAPLDSKRREELLRFVEWQAQRFEQSQITRKEYEYVLVQKESELHERQHLEEVKEKELGLMQRQLSEQRVTSNIQLQQLAAQRSMALSQSLQALSSTLSYRPMVNCTSYNLGSVSNISCR